MEELRGAEKRRDEKRKEKKRKEGTRYEENRNSVTVFTLPLFNYSFIDPLIITVSPLPTELSTRIISVSNVYIYVNSRMPSYRYSRSIHHFHSLYFP